MHAKQTCMCEMHGRMHSNYRLTTIFLVIDPLSTWAYPMMTYLLPAAVANKLPISYILGNYQQAYIHTNTHAKQTCTHEHLITHTQNTHARACMHAHTNMVHTGHVHTLHFLYYSRHNFMTCLP